MALRIASLAPALGYVLYGLTVQSTDAIIGDSWRKPKWLPPEGM